MSTQPPKSKSTPRVKPDRLVPDLELYFASHAHLPDGAALILALWTLNTCVFDLFETTPYIALESATTSCGKTTVLSLLLSVCARPRMLTAMSEAALFRLIDKESPTLLIDEAELLSDRGERFDAIRAAIHAGYKKGATVPRCVGESHEVREFKVFCPKAFAAIGGLKGALLDRSVVIHLERVPFDLVLSSTRQWDLTRATEHLKPLLEQYRKQWASQLERLYRSEPDGGYWTHIRGRDAELFGPLLLHARLAGRAIEERALQAVKALCATRQEVKDTEGEVLLIHAAVEALESLTQPEFAASDLLSALLKHEAWVFHAAQFRHNQHAAEIGRFLRPFRIPRRILHGCTRYSRSEAIRKLKAHLPLEPHPTPPTTPAVQSDDDPQEGDGVGMGDVPARGTRTNGKGSCYVHPRNQTNWWMLEDGTAICGVCHPNPATL